MAMASYMHACSTHAGILAAEVGICVPQVDAYGAVLHPSTGEMPAPIGAGGQVGICAASPPFALSGAPSHADAS